jgi:Flp pilus assembly protein TadG
VLVESSFALLPLLALLFGVIDIAFAVFVRNTMQFAVRQGVRYAVTSQTMAGMGQDQSIKTTVNTYSMGLLNGLSPTHDGMSQISITYYDPVSLAVVTGPNSNVGGNIVVVSCSGLSWAWMVPLMRSAAPMQFSVSSADLMEGTPLAGPPAR